MSDNSLLSPFILPEQEKISIPNSLKNSTLLATDYYNLDALLEDKHLETRTMVRAWVEREVLPIIEDYTEKAETPTHLYKSLAKIGALGTNLPTKYGCGGQDEITYGIYSQELERGDSAIRSMASVQSSLVMYPIYRFGSEEQKEYYLPKLASAEFIGCFGLTEPNHGSNPLGMLTNIVDDGDAYILNGSKMWITNAPIADIALVWAKDENGKIRGIIVEKGMKGFSAPKIGGKLSFRASITGELIFEDVRVPKENILPNVKGMKGPLSCLSKARFGIFWGMIGVAIDCYEAALQYSIKNPSIGASQLVQKKLAEMITEITKAQLLSWRLGTLANKGKVKPAQISMAKRNNVQTAMKVSRAACQILGPAGMTSAYPIMRHLMNLESVVTYEGTHDIHLLITGMDVTGYNAFK
ncbi:MAG: acyl-CoA dehydrogenase family protein [Aureispira sp.]